MPRSGVCVFVAVSSSWDARDVSLCASSSCESCVELGTMAINVYAIVPSSHTIAYSVGSSRLCRCSRPGVDK